MIFPTLAPLVSPVVLADAGPFGAAAAPPAVVAQSTLTVVVHHQAPQSARAAGVRLERLAECFEQLTSGGVEAVLAVIGRAPFDADEIAGFVGAGAAAPAVFELADDPLAAAVLAGRSGVSRRRLLRLPLLRSSAALTAFLSNRLTELGAIDRWRVDR